MPFFGAGALGVEACGAAFCFAVLGVRADPWPLDGCEGFDGCAFFIAVGCGCGCSFAEFAGTCLGERGFCACCWPVAGLDLAGWDFCGFAGCGEAFFALEEEDGLGACFGFSALGRACCAGFTAPFWEGWVTGFAAGFGELLRVEGVFGEDLDGVVLKLAPRRGR